MPAPLHEWQRARADISHDTLKLIKVVLENRDAAGGPDDLLWDYWTRERDRLLAAFAGLPACLLPTSLLIWHEWLDDWSRAQRRFEEDAMVGGVSLRTLVDAAIAGERDFTNRLRTCVMQPTPEAKAAALQALQTVQRALSAVPRSIVFPQWCFPESSSSTT